MSIQINEYIDQASKAIIDQYGISGGSLRFYSWRLNKSQSNVEELTPYNIHKVVARQTIERLNYETARRWNSVVTEFKRSQYPNLGIDYDELDQSGLELSVDEFLGFDYDWENEEPKFKGKKIEGQWYFDFDNYEYDESKRKLELKGLKYNRGFIQAFFFPPLGMSFGKDKSDAIESFNIFTRINFGGLRELKIYAWSVDCTHFFKFGKEWWGSYFWTVHNPLKNIFIGIVGSDSD